MTGSSNSLSNLQRRSKGIALGDNGHLFVDAFLAVEQFNFPLGSRPRELGPQRITLVLFLILIPGPSRLNTYPTSDKEYLPLSSTMPYYSTIICQDFIQWQTIVFLLYFALDRGIPASDPS